MGPPLQTLSRLPPGELSPEGGGGVQKRTLLRQLIAYLAMIAPSPTPAGPLAPDDLLRVPWRKHGKRFSPSEDPTEPLGTSDGAGMRHSLEDPRKDRAAVETLSPPDLDEVAGVISDAADVEGAWEGPRGAGGEPGEPVDSSEAALGEGAHGGGGAPDTRARDGGAHGHGEVGPVSLSRGDVLQGPGSRRPPGAPPGAPPATGMEQAEGPVAALSSEEDTIGVENVRSRTYSTELLARPRSEPRAHRLGELPHWVPGASQEQEGPGHGLRLEVKSPEEAYGYIVTESDPLSLEKGKQLLADITGLLQVPTSVLADTEVLGPAVTFRVSANVQNVTPADVVKAAGKVLSTQLHTCTHMQAP
ncbi:PREDICTED: receptor-type tyrosine-protein phosphatase N2, partial [Myotis davidii]|uniref:receptor-type tyrosine-protein phosphatase N2 n=1 Tax=Myotis davidii TaxID=225400 RepID=UPI0007671C78